MKNAKEYKALFEEIYNSGDEIINNTTGESFEAEDGEVFRQCWSDSVARRELPKYWFISDKENLLSVKNDKIVWLNKNKRKGSNKISYKFARETEEGTKNQNIEAHNLVGLVWGSDSFGLATKLLEDKGIDAIGINDKENIVVQGHHKNQNDTDNRPENIKFITDKIHMALGKIVHPNASAEKHFEYMDELAEVILKENPNEITLVLNGYVYDKSTGTWSNDGDVDVVSLQKIKISAEALKQLQRLFDSAKQ